MKCQQQILIASMMEDLNNKFKSEEERKGSEDNGSPETPAGNKDPFFDEFRGNFHNTPQNAPAINPKLASLINKMHAHHPDLDK